MAARSSPRGRAVACGAPSALERPPLNKHWRLQQRIQRYGWDLAARDYEPLWQEQLAPAQALLQKMAALAPGQRVLDVACGTGLVSFDAAHAVGPFGSVVGVDLSGAMVEAASQVASTHQVRNAEFMRMDAQELEFGAAQFDAALCALGLMYMPQPERAMAQIARVLKPGGEATFSVWGARARCGWASVFPIVDAEVQSEVCPMFFQLGLADSLAQECEMAGMTVVGHERISATLCYDDADQACDAMFIGGPVALAWSRFDAPTRLRVRERYLQSIEPWRHAQGFRVPGEFVVVKAAVAEAA
jgi:ubiquinone/menaquinone biosynthesis C-methylase UbiE